MNHPARAAAALLAAMLGGCSGNPAAPTDALTFTFDFRRGPQGFVAGFADYPPGNADIYELTSDHRALPPPLASDSALFISGVNRSADLFMFFKGPVDGLLPGASYGVTVSVEIATDVPAGCFGVGGAPGESVWVKAGATAVEPLAVRDGAYLRMNIDIGNQSAGGQQGVVLGDVANSIRANRLFGPASLPGAAPAEARSRARDRLFEALQAVHLRGETHVTVRELRAALVYILFGVHFCDDYHEGTVATGRRRVPDYWEPSFGRFPEPGAPTGAPAETGPASLPWWDRAFDPESPGRQGAVLTDLARFDPALDAHPRIDRHLVRPTQAGVCRGVPGFPDLDLASARRRAYFEWREHDIESLTGDPHALDLAHGRHLHRFRRLAVDDGARKAACRALCAGMAGLATLPPQAYDRPEVVPLRITPRTPTETAFWIEKPADRFRLEADLPPVVASLDRLHRQAVLVYRYANGHEEHLRLGAELFHLLMELSEGYQLGDASTDDTFAHLSIFVQRLEREDDRRLLAWNPMRDDRIYEVVAESASEDGPQRIVIRPLV